MNPCFLNVPKFFPDTEKRTNLSFLRKLLITELGINLLLDRDFLDFFADMLHRCDKGGFPQPNSSTVNLTKLDPPNVQKRSGGVVYCGHSTLKII